MRHGGLTEFAPADFRFAPDAARAARVDQVVRARLADSLEKIFAAGRGVLAFRRADLTRLLGEIGGGPVRAATMALYSDLVGAVFADDLPAAQLLADALLTPPVAAPAGRIFTLDDACLGAGQAARFMRIISDDGAVRLAFHPFAPRALAEVTQATRAALDLLAAGAPELAGEIDVLVREIVLVDLRQPAAGETLLGGSSIFYLWGASFIACNRPPSRLELADALAHEAAHVLLFGLSLGKALVRNGPEARYGSPLRDDPRPMEGIVHAAYVLARLSWTLRRLRGSGVLRAAEAEIARSWEARNRRDFSACLDIIEAEADFTALGAAVFGGAAAYMRAGGDGGADQGVVGCAKARNPPYG